MKKYEKLNLFNDLQPTGHPFILLLEVFFRP